MDITSVESNNNTQTDQHPLLREQRSSNNNHEHVIDIARNGDSSHTSQAPGTSSEDQPTVETRAPDNQVPSSSSIRLNSRNSFTRRSEGYHRSPLNSGLWISIELILTLSQIVASIAVLLSSRNEHPHAPLFEWIVGYASGCVATLPILYYRYWNRYQGDGQEVPQLQEASSQSNPAEPSSYTAMSLTQMTNEQNLHVSGATTTNSQTGTSSLRASRVVDHFKMTLDCFFAVWFVVGIVWMFGGHASSGDAPKLYRLCVVFLTFSCIGYAMPFILCLTICCCLPCIIHVLGVEENASQTRGATDESISALPTYLFKLKKDESGEDRDSNTEEGECGFLESGTGKKRFISGEDSVCCICLAEYTDGDELRELPCVHVFHVDCVDKWLKINACCPLCKSDVGERIGGSAAARESVQQ